MVDGQHLVHKIEYSKRNYYTEQPLQDIIIHACGQLPLKKPYYVPSHPYTFVFNYYINTHYKVHLEKFIQFNIHFFREFRELLIFAGITTSTTSERII